MAEAQRIKSDQQALEAARQFAEQIRTGSAARDKERRLPFEEIEWFSQTGLWGITVPKEYGGGGGSSASFNRGVAGGLEGGGAGGQKPPQPYRQKEKISPGVGARTEKEFFFLNFC